MLMYITDCIIYSVEDTGRLSEYDQLAGAGFYRKVMYMTEKEKYYQIRKEAMWTGITLVVLICFWIFAGFGLSSVDIRVFGLPLWAVTGTFGVWFFAMVLVKLLTTLVFKDIDLETDTNSSGREGRP